MDFLFDVALINLLRGLLLIVVLAPGLAGLCVWVFRDVPVGWAHIFTYLGQVDSGFQLGLNSYILRAALLMLAGVSVLLGLPVPPEGRWIWRCSWTFIVVAAISAARCSHPYEALLTVFDTALLNIVVLITLHFRPRNWLPLAYVVGATLTAVFSIFTFLGGELYVNDEARLNGTFFQPNVTAAFLAAALPWFINWYLGGQRSPRVKMLSGLALIPVYLAFILTGTRAAMLVTFLILVGRCWLGGCRLRGVSWAVAVLQAGLVALAFLGLSWLGVFYSLGLILSLLLLAVVARRSGLSWLSVIFLSLLCFSGYKAQLWVAHFRQNEAMAITRRVADLPKGSDPSFLARREFWRTAILMGLEHPWLGVGPRGFHRYYPGCQSDVRWFSKFCHSASLSCFAEVGFPGLILMLVLMVQWLFIVVRGLKIPTLAVIAPEKTGALTQDSASSLVEMLLNASASVLILTLCMAVDVQWQFPMLPVLLAMWIGLSLSCCWREVPGPAQIASSSQLSPWTIRPQVLRTYFFLAVIGISAAFNVTFALAQSASEKAELLLKSNNVSQALKCDQDSILLNPFQGAYYHHYGQTYSVGLAKKIDKLSPEMFLHIAERAVALDSHRAVHWDLLYKALVLNQKNDQARMALQRALECDPVNYPSFYVNLAQLMTRPEERSERERVLLTCSERFPTGALAYMFNFRSSDIVRQLAEVYMLLADQTDPEQPELALSYYNRYLKLQPDDPNARLGRIVCLINLGKLPEAQREAVALFRKTPQEESAQVLKVIYEIQHLHYNPDDFVLKTQPK